MKIRRLTSNAPRPQSRRGAVVAYEKNGHYVISKWPRKRNIIHPNQQQGVDAMKRIAWMTLNADPNEVTAAYALAGRTGYTWKDVLQAAFYGRIVVGIAADGSQIAPWSLYVTVINDLLNSIADQPGMMLVRGANAWEAVPAGNTALVLMWDATTGLPRWQNPSLAYAGGAPSIRMSQPSFFAQTVSTSAFCFKGSIISVQSDVYLSAVSMLLSQPVALAHYVAVCGPVGTLANTMHYTAAPDTSATTIYRGGTVPAPVWVRCVFSPRLHLVPNQNYCLCVGRNDNTATYALNAIAPAAGSASPPPSPINFNNFARIASLAPTTASNIDTNSSAAGFTPTAVEWAEA